MIFQDRYYVPEKEFQVLRYLLKTRRGLYSQISSIYLTGCLTALPDQVSTTFVTAAEIILQNLLREHIMLHGGMVKRPLAFASMDASPKTFLDYDFQSCRNITLAVFPLFHDLVSNHQVTEERFLRSWENASTLDRVLGLVLVRELAAGAAYMFSERQVTLQLSGVRCLWLSLGSRCDLQSPNITYECSHAETVLLCATPEVFLKQYSDMIPGLAHLQEEPLLARFHGWYSRVDFMLTQVLAGELIWLNLLLPLMPLILNMHALRASRYIAREQHQPTSQVVSIAQKYDQFYAGLERVHSRLRGYSFVDEEFENAQHWLKLFQRFYEPKASEFRSELKGMYESILHREGEEVLDASH